MANRAVDWFAQSEHDLRLAEVAQQAGSHEWACRVLENFYVSSRYPNGHPEGSPWDHYGPLQSGEALKHAGEIIAFVRAEMA